VDLAVLG